MQEGQEENLKEKKEIMIFEIAQSHLKLVSVTHFKRPQ